MANPIRVGVIGTGRKDVKKGPLGYAMAYEHGRSYQEIESCELVGCADIVPENAAAFAEHFGFRATWTDYREMLAEAQLEAVSICTWMALHEQMVVDCIEAGVKAIHCEKPMASSWRGAKRIATMAAEAGVQLTFNHQRRFGAPYQKARAIVASGELGKLLRFESEFGNIYDTGTHFIDMMSFFLGDGIPARWVLAQIDYRTENLVFGGHCENQQTLLFEYENGVFGFVYSGRPEGNKPLGVVNRLIFEQGIVDVGVGHGPQEALRVMKYGDGEFRWIDTEGEGIHGPGFIQRAIADVIDCYQTGRPCMLRAENALIATELIFGAWESSRRRGRVDFPLDPAVGNPLQEMVESGDLHPARPEA